MFPTPQYSFADIIAPISVEEFFSEYYGKKHLYIPGSPAKFQSVLTWDMLNNLLNMGRIWDSNTLMLVLDRQQVPPREFCENQVASGGTSILRPDAKKVMEWLKKGATLGLNDIDSLTPGISAIANAIEEKAHAKVQANLYCSWQQRKAFAPHFDSHDVYAVHLEGEKVWRLYESQMDHPINHPDFKQQSASQERFGKIIDEVTLKPGDFLYIPRGCYHDALSSTEATYHIAFGATGIIGLDLLDILKSVSLHQESFRLNLPRQEDGKDALQAYCHELGEILQQTLQSEQFVNSLQEYQRSYHYERGGFDLPVKADTVRYTVSVKGLQVGKQGNQAFLKQGQQAVGIPPHYADVMKWVIKTGSFDRESLAKAHKKLSIMDIDQFIIDCQRMKIIAAI